jgi:ppGpp synthetase/RelA/SpoT-type nucleotidyltranferase
MPTNAPADKLNLMGMYFTYGRPTYKIIGDMRKAIFRVKSINDITPADINEARISSADIIAAQKENVNVRREIDESTPEYAQDLNNLIFGKDPVRAMLIVKGDFLGEGGIEDTILYSDLGTNPWPLYQGREGFDTLDTKLTLEKTSEYLNQYQQDLVQRRITGFDVKESSFYYFRDGDLRRNFGTGNGAIDFRDLVRYMVDTHGYVGTEKVSKPNEQEYREKAVSFTSYRQKLSLAEKIKRKLCQQEPYEDGGDIISDWGAHRICLATEEEAQAMGLKLQNSRNLGRFQMNIAYIDDYYSKPKGNGFKAFNFAVQVSPSRRPATVREIQVYGLMQHYNAQINEKSPAYHRRFRDKQLHSRQKKRAVLEAFEYDSVLELMFGTEKMVVYLNNNL